MTPFENVINCYADGKMKNLLLKYGISKPEFFRGILNDEKPLQVSFHYYNLFVIVEFEKSGYEYSIYTPNCSAEDVENSIVRKTYATDFSVDVFFDNIMHLLNSDSRLVKATPANDKKKRYKTISRICFGITMMTIAVPAVYVLITDSTIQLGPWFLVPVLGPLIVSEVFDFLANKS